MSKALPMVYKMKRLYRCFMGICEGISIHHKPMHGEHYVRIDFATDREASDFYRELSSVDPVRVPVETNPLFRTTSATGTW